MDEFSYYSYKSELFLIVFMGLGITCSTINVVLCLDTSSACYYRERVGAVDGQ